MQSLLLGDVMMLSTLTDDAAESPLEGARSQLVMSGRVWFRAHSSWRKARRRVGYFEHYRRAIGGIQKQKVYKMSFRWLQAIADPIALITRNIILSRQCVIEMVGTGTFMYIQWGLVASGQNE